MEETKTDFKVIEAKMEELSKWIKAEKKAKEMSVKLKNELNTMLQKAKMENVKTQSLSAYYAKGRVSYSIIPGKEDEAVNNYWAVMVPSYELIDDTLMLSEGVDKGIIDKKEGAPSLVVKLAK